ncbi:MAG: monofunctional biosynthetic peptidoglycan transglycosylase [Bacteroidetes bacterium]|nr:monofunctional biosynthetic peptidoglycan transglycosylase [Bacteroidota bacterium]MBL0259250.1 monofunctional biosynthetic peptidoglycan transglycosylase [Bacteroidota bacterium]MBP6403060.1 monofunctional biosynthetic peptidoglycan transglycosylase [Bacteroidia bacterium]MBP6648942.1 monofunctional biosynthetic peptidoglycan transglycosylase [Bacteroidia bacterium]
MLKKIFRFFLKAIILFLVLSIASVLLFRFVPIPFTPLMLIRCVEQKSDGKDMKLRKDWTSIDEMSAAMPLAVIASEDQNFEEHFGFDMDAIRKAQAYNDRHKGKRMKGASTISQQTAKNVFLWPSRSWIRKGFEVYFTFLIELFWSKQRIMEVYLNVIEMGNGVYGTEAAAQEYFHKPAKKLSMREAALIAAVLPNPRKWSPAKPSAYIQRKSSRIIHFMSRLKLEDF